MMRYYGIHMKGGIITERDADYCTVRVRLPAGILSIEQMRGIARIAKKYQAGEVHLTTRQTIEIPHVDHRLIAKIARDLSKNGTPLGSERDEIVNITACPGTDRCKYANIDTVKLARDLDSRLFGKEMPVKVRIALSACPYACTSPVLNEIGVTGRIKPVRTPGLCTGCGTCAEYCKECAISIKNGISYVDESKCILCGVCVQSCPFDLLKTEDAHYLITVGGRRGRHPKLGRELVEVATAEETIAIIERIVTWIYRRAWSGRLLSDQLDDIHFDAFRKEILEDVENKAEE
jgi:anaerobic sulfite reductase subunit C